ncbi:MAG: leucine-rich repeat domain-containing protein, partial [Treponemataceae bacterium]|nr:leucine-rich repeat domain-containing protein [Treponemataceae bacterium]
MKKQTWLAALCAAMMALPFAGCDNGSSEPEDPGVVYKDGWLLAGSTVRQYRGAETSVTTPEGVTRIGEHAFENCTGITEVTIRDGVTVIDDYAFYGCENLAEVTIPASVALIGSGAFSGCALETVRYGGTVGQWCAVDGIGSLARAEHVSVSGIEDLNGTATLEIPDGTKTIAAYAFYYCESLTDVTVPASVTRIGGDAFPEDTALKALQFKGTTEQWRAIEGCGTVAVPYIQCSDGGLGVKDAPAYLKLYGTKVTGYADGLPEKLVIPDGVTEIGRGAFQDCTSLVSVEIPGSVTSIEDGSYRYGAFYGCTNLTSVTIGDGMTSIGDYAFDGCTSLTSVTIPTSVTEIGEYAFSLKEIQFPGTKEQWQAIEGSGGVNATCIFCTDGHIGIENVPDYLTMSGTVVTGYVDGLPENLVIPDGVTGIESRAFQNCTSLVSVELPGSVERIGKYSDWGSNGTFYGCTNLTSVTIGNGVTEIGSYAFYGCESLTSMEIPDGVTKIEDSMFRNCTNLASVKIPDNVTSIGDEAFRKCTSLTSVKIPDNVTEIGDEAFRNCTNLAEVTIGNSVTTIGSDAFRKCTSLASVKSIGHYAFDGCTNLNTVTYNGTLAQWCAMDNDNSLMAKRVTLTGEDNMDLKQAETLVIPNGVTYIGKYAFYNCASLAEMTIPASVTAIGGNAFSLKEVQFKGTKAQWQAIEGSDAVK